MCNIAGYAGNRRAAPILLEMLKRQQYFDGQMSAGIATVYEGKLHWRKVVGDVETLIRETDALDLPGTVGIAHTRPSGTPDSYELAHPYISMDGEMAVVSNGTTPKDKYTPQRDVAVQMLGDAGFKFRTATDDPRRNWPRLKNGLAVGSGEVRVHLIDYYIKRGKSYAEACALTAQHLYTDNVLLALNQNSPDTIYAIRTVRPMNVLLGDGETYMATTKFGFPDDVQGETMMLPLMHACEITRGGVNITPYRVNVEKVCDVNPQIYAEAYSFVSNYLKGRKDDPALVFGGDLGKELCKHIDGLWPEEHTFKQYARLSYDIYEQLYAEGKLKMVIGDEKCRSGVRKRYYLWIE